MRIIFPKDKQPEPIKIRNGEINFMANENKLTDALKSKKELLLFIGAILVLGIVIYFFTRTKLVPLPVPAAVPAT